MARPIGSINKAPSQLMMAREACLQLNFEPFVKLVELAMQSDDENLSLRATRELAGYLAPKLQAIQISGLPEEPVILNLNMAPKSEP